MRKFLDRLYTFSGALAAICLLILLFIIVAQMICRWIGVSFPGSTAYAGYFMAASSFFAFAYALNADSHIRVSLFLNALGERRFWAEVWCFTIGTLASGYLAFYAVRLVQGSIQWNDISQGRDATPLWIPQIPVAIGAILLAICFLDNLVTLFKTRDHNMNGEKFSGPEV